MQGLGDNIYQRAFIKTLARDNEIYLETSWPELYADLPVKVINPQTRLRTQAKNVARSRAAWVGRPTHIRNRKRIGYGGRLAYASIIGSMETCFGIALEPANFDLPALPPSPVSSSRPIAFVRPVTVRSEWFNSARNPEPQYLIDVVEALRRTHTIVCVADLQDGAEWAIGPQPHGDVSFLRGELKVMDMLALMAASDIVLGGVGFIVPASIALKTNCFVILGGNGAHAGPDKILDRRLDCSKIGFAMPRDFCKCSNMRHTCNKAIPDLMDQLSRFLHRNSTARPQAFCSGMPAMASAISP